MKNLPTVLAAVFVVVVLLTYMCTFEVRSTEVAIVKTAGKPADEAITQPGLKFKLPWPIQSVVKYDNRKRILSDKTEETGTADEKNVILSTYTIWQIVNPSKFHENFPKESDGEKKLRTLIQTCKNQEIGKRQFAEFVSVDDEERHLREIEQTIAKTVREAAEDEYGVAIVAFGIKKLTLPEAVTVTIFSSMKATQEAKSQRYTKEGEAKAKEIVASARATEQRILAAAQTKVAEIEAETQRIVSEYYKKFDEYPELRIFLDKLRTTTMALKERATLILDTSGPPFDLFREEFIHAIEGPSSQGALPTADTGGEDSTPARSMEGK